MSGLYDSGMFGLWLYRHQRKPADPSSPVPPTTEAAASGAQEASASFRAAVEGAAATTAEILAYSPLPARTGPSLPVPPPLGEPQCLGCTSAFIDNLLALLQSVSKQFVFLSFVFTTPFQQHVSCFLF